MIWHSKWEVIARGEKRKGECYLCTCIICRWRVGFRHRQLHTPALTYFFVTIIVRLVVSDHASAQAPACTSWRILRWHFRR